MKHLPFAGVVASVLVANAATAHWGLVSVAGLTATAGTWAAGFAFVARDALHERGGPRWVLAAILAGAALSAALSPTLAMASGVAFLIAELADWSVYAPLRRRGLLRAAVASNAVGAVVDSALFLTLAGFPLGGMGTQVLVKIAATTAVVMGVRLAVLRQPHRAGGERHA